MAGNLESSTEVTFEVRGEGRVISNWAFTHFSAAKYFATKVLEIERANEGAPFGNFWGEIGIYWGVVPEFVLLHLLRFYTCY